VSLRDGLEQKILLGSSRVFLSWANTGQEVWVVTLGEGFYHAGVTEMSKCDPQIEQRRTATYNQLSVIWINDGQGARPVRVELDLIIRYAEKPWLSVMTRGGEHRVVQQETQLLANGRICRIFGL
jgi:hypothetical protein